MINVALGLAGIVVAVALTTALRARGDQPHPLMLRAGMDVIAPLLILSFAVAGIGLVINGGVTLWGGM